MYHACGNLARIVLGNPDPHLAASGAELRIQLRTTGTSCPPHMNHGRW